MNAYILSQRLRMYCPIAVVEGVPYIVRHRTLLWNECESSSKALVTTSDALVSTSVLVTTSKALVTSSDAL